MSATAQALIDPYSFDDLKNRLITPSIRSIRLNGKLFQLPDGQTSPGPMMAVVLDFVYYNALFGATYNPNVIAAPICWSLSGTPSGAMPSIDNPIHPTCDDCPKNQWGSAGPGMKGKACKNNVRLAVIDPTNPEGEIYKITGSPVANGNWNKYVTGLRARGIHFRKVITAINCSPKSTVPILEFSMNSFHEVDDGLIGQLYNRVTTQQLLWRDPTAN